MSIFSKEVMDREMHLTLMLLISNTSLNFNEFFLSLKEPPVLFHLSVLRFFYSSSVACIEDHSLLLKAPGKFVYVSLWNSIHTTSG